MGGGGSGPWFGYDHFIFNVQVDLNSLKEFTLKYSGYNVDTTCGILRLNICQNTQSHTNIPTEANGKKT